ncbi:hypothetical protein TCAL_10712 [Tigriopus californicus]|uniref:long-chain-fatty-acid--CoA ligase n=1 Tax=Tigriopus californicus TaxID=6832 RepID=A0A553N9C3_TIGCA|nr:long-chain-fatty-acid--CoA ligase ACSBG2-like [Tigriopus californicus]XP_059088824.1 long-chain-fatty-acid--CoA ligase ACSBG2-like [Tigriopus californicus]TRY61989.1 hypothetical protein TCAL_10712 [Tigriopus californicus]|eukprot:TCALIF_10712-PA protein Name:"Similar to acsbg2 Long-chain-fatty-acid--CoA ligase ACSBG2 (Xenopus laevis)" AED:0.04 eAED:0.04 QI:7/1/1/1/0.75/0.6/5/91/696
MQSLTNRLIGRMWGRALRRNDFQSRLERTLVTNGIVAPADRYLSWDKFTPVKLRMEEVHPGNIPPTTVSNFLKDHVEQFWSRTALCTKVEDKWVGRTFEQYYQEVQITAKAFLALGLGSKEGVGILGNNCPEWMIASVASIVSGGLSCGMYTTSSKQTVQFIADNVPVTILVIENQAFLNQILLGRNLTEVFPTVKKVILMEGAPNSSQHSSSFVLSWQQMLEVGRTESGSNLASVEKHHRANEACLIIYTSGTTGEPKGAMISHDNIVWSCKIVQEHFSWHQEDVLSYLPLSHVSGLMVDCYLTWSSGSTIYFGDKNVLKGTLPRFLQDVRPTRFLGVPRVWEKIGVAIQAKAAQGSSTKRALGMWARNKQMDHIRRKRSGDNKFDWSHSIAKRLVLSRVHEALGLDRAVAKDGLYSGAATLSAETFAYFQSLGINLQSIYGCSEATGPQTTNLSDSTSPPEFMGLPFLGVRNTILNPDKKGVGEVAVRSRNVFMGYLNDEPLTQESFTEDSGWFKTGDLGRFESDGSLELKGRIKELLITSGGKNISPIPIENRIKHALPELISNVVLVGEQRHYLTCLITPRVKIDPETTLPTTDLDDSVLQWLAIQGLTNVMTTFDLVREVETNAVLAKAIQSQIDLINESAQSKPECVQKFRVLPEDFSIHGGQLGPTLKLKRHRVMQQYKPIIDQMYLEG